MGIIQIAPDDDLGALLCFLWALFHKLVCSAVKIPFGFVWFFTH